MLLVCRVVILDLAVLDMFFTTATLRSLAPQLTWHVVALTSNQATLYCSLAINMSAPARPYLSNGQVLQRHAHPVFEP